ncbi:hypothetical protein DFJ74DRAFT_297129 [Hyaloraphidium curvatum]|nr:hypothetical protein DFJ74DRAFT_297129 [Hyaloraphidium curvatum]
MLRPVGLLALPRAVVRQLAPGASLEGLLRPVVAAPGIGANAQRLGSVTVFAQPLLLQLAEVAPRRLGTGRSDEHVAGDRHHPPAQDPEFPALVSLAMHGGKRRPRLAHSRRETSPAPEAAQVEEASWSSYQSPQTRLTASRRLMSRNSLGTAARLTANVPSRSRGRGSPPTTSCTVSRMGTSLRPTRAFGAMGPRTRGFSRAVCMSPFRHERHERGFGKCGGKRSLLLVKCREAHRLRHSDPPMATFRRVLEFAELSSFLDANTGRLIPEKLATGPGGFPPVTTTYKFWGIKTAADVQSVMASEMEWLIEHADQARPLLGRLIEAGWASSAEMLDMLLAMSSVGSSGAVRRRWFCSHRTVKQSGSASVGQDDLAAQMDQLGINQPLRSALEPPGAPPAQGKKKAPRKRHTKGKKKNQQTVPDAA